MSDKLYVVFSGTSPEGSMQGCCQIEYGKVESMEDIANLVTLVRENNPKLRTCVITNWRRFE